MMKLRKLVTIILTLAMLLSTGTVSAFEFSNLIPDLSFRDVTESNPDYESITELENRKYVIGIAEDIYAPNDYTTRAEFLKMLLFAVNKNQDAEYKNILTDVPEEHWASHYIMRGLEVGIFDCDELIDYQFNPDIYIDKETAALWITRAMGRFVEADLTVDDKEQIIQKEAVATVLNMEIMTADNNVFSPKNNFNRSTAAVIVKTVMDIYAEKNTDRESTNTITYKENVKQIVTHENDNINADSTTENILIENTDEYCIIENPNNDLLSLNKDDVFIIKPCSKAPYGTAVKIENKEELSNNVIKYYKSKDIKIEDVVTEMDICQNIPIDPKNIVPANDSVEISLDTDTENLAQINTVASLSEEDMQAPKQASYENDIINFVITLKDTDDNISKDVKIIMGAKLKTDIEWKLLGAKKVEAQLVTRTKISGEISGKAETSIPLYNTVVPLGATGLLADVVVSLNFGIDGSVSFEVTQTNNTGFSYSSDKNNEKISEPDNPNSSEFKFEGSFYVGAECDVKLTLVEVLNLGIEAKGDIGIEAGFNTHSFNATCLKGNVFYKVSADAYLEAGVGTFKYRPVDISIINIKKIFGKCYLHRQWEKDYGEFGWGDCPYLKSGNNNSVNTITTGEMNFGAGNQLSNIATGNNKGYYYLAHYQGLLYNEPYKYTGIFEEKDGEVRLIYKKITNIKGLYAYNNYLYFLDKYDLYRINLDNYSTVKIYNDNVYNMYVDDEILYFSVENGIKSISFDDINSSGDANSAPYFATKDDLALEKDYDMDGFILTFNDIKTDGFQIKDKKIYAAVSLGQYGSIDPETKERTLISDYGLFGSHSDCNIVDDVTFYITKNVLGGNFGHEEICMVKNQENGNSSPIISYTNAIGQPNVWTLNVYNNYIYYITTPSDSHTKMTLHKTDISGKSDIEIASFEGSFGYRAPKISIINDTIFIAIPTSGFTPINADDITYGNRNSDIGYLYRININTGEIQSGFLINNSFIDSANSISNSQNIIEDSTNTNITGENTSDNTNSGGEITVSEYGGYQIDFNKDGNPETIYVEESDTRGISYAVMVYNSAKGSGEFGLCGDFIQSAKLSECYIITDPSTGISYIKTVSSLSDANDITRIYALNGTDFECIDTWGTFINKDIPGNYRTLYRTGFDAVDLGYTANGELESTEAEYEAYKQKYNFTVTHYFGDDVK